MKLEIIPHYLRELVAQTTAPRLGEKSRSKSKFWTYVNENMTPEQAAMVKEFVEAAWGMAAGSKIVGDFEVEQTGREIRLYVLKTNIDGQTMEVPDLETAKEYLNKLALDATVQLNGHADWAEKVQMTQGRKGSGVVANFNHRLFRAALIEQ